MAARRALVRANGRAFAVPQRAPVVGVLIDGNEEAYVDAALAAGRMPHWQRIRDRQSGPQRSTYGLVRCVMPTFTNPNNVAVVTGTPPAVNGICGNFFINEEGEEVMMNDPAFLRCGTIFGKAAPCASSFEASKRLRSCPRRSRHPDLRRNRERQAPQAAHPRARRTPSALLRVLR